MMFFEAGHWGHLRLLGERADYCPGCLQLSRFTVRSIRECPHLYFIPLEESKEVERVSECDLCGAVIHGLRSYSTARGASLQQLIAETNPSLNDERVARLEAELNAAGPDARTEKALNWFLAQQERLLKKIRSGLGPLALLVSLPLSLFALRAFVIGGPRWGWPTAIVAAVLGVSIDRWDKERRAAKQIKPRLRAFLACKGLTLQELDRRFADDPSPFCQLRRHLRKRYYEDLRLEWSSGRNSTGR
jgi:hypothetical protein